MALSYRLIKFFDVTVYREGAGSYVNGVWVEGTTSTFNIKAKIQPLSGYQVAIMPESDRTRSWIKVFTPDTIRQKKEGPNGHGADRLYWNGDLYEVMKVFTWSKTVQDHIEAHLVRVELTPN